MADGSCRTCSKELTLRPLIIIVKSSVVSEAQMNSERTPLPFLIAIAGVLATLVFAWQAAASSGVTGAGRTFVGWIPRGYSVEAVAMSAMIASVLHPARIHSRWSIDAAWFGCGALTAIAVMSAMTVGGTLVPGIVLASAAASAGSRQE